MRLTRYISTDHLSSGMLNHLLLYAGVVEQVSLASLGVATAQRCSLTLLRLRDKQDVNSAVKLPPMELQAFIVTLR